MPAKSYILYMHTSPSGKVYIGITCQKATCRWVVGGCHYQKQTYFWNAISKYGWDNFKHEILLYNLSKKDACFKEKEYIAKYRSNNPTFGYNLTTGGESGYEMPDVVSKKMSASIKKKWQDPTYREKVSSSCGCKGSHWSLSEETKSKMRKPKSEETKAKMRKPKSPETKKKMSEAKRKYFDSMTPEQRKQIFGTRNRREKLA